MARWLKQSTSVDVPIGPFLDATDGVTPETGLTITQPDIRLKKNGGAWAQKAAAQTLSHEENGFYEVTLDATDTNTLGLMRLAVFESGAAPVWEDFLVVPANVWDSYFSTDLLQVDATQWLGSAIATPTVAGVPEVDVTHWIGTAAATPTVAGVPEVDITHFGGAAGTFASGRPEVNTSHVAGNTTAATILSRIYGGAAVTGTADSGTTTTMVDAALTQADSGYWTGGWIVFTSGNISGQCRRIVSFVPGTDTVNFFPATTQAVSTQNYVIIPSTNAADDVWEAATADYASVGTFGEALDLNSIADAVWDELTAAHNGGSGVAGSFGELVISTENVTAGLPDAGAISTAVWSEALDGSTTAAESMRLQNSALGGKASGLGTTTVVFRDINDTKNRISATVDVDGNRSAVTLDLT